MKNKLKLIALFWLIGFSAYAQFPVSVQYGNAVSGNDILEANFLKESVILGNYSAAIPAMNTQLFSFGLRKQGGFNPYLTALTITSNQDVEIEIQIKSAVGVADLRGVSNYPVSIKAGIVQNIAISGQLLWGQSIFAIFKSSTGSGMLILRMAYSGYETPTPLRLFAPKGNMFIGDSITYGANAGIGNDPVSSWASIVNDKVNTANGNNLIFLNKGIPGITAEGSLLALKSGYIESNKNVALIPIALGTNTSPSDDSYGNSIRGIISLSLSRYPKAKILIIAPIVRNDASETILIRYRAILSSIVSDLSLPNVKYLDTSSLGILPGVTSSDVHPNSTGHATLGNYIYNSGIVANGWTIL